MWDYLEILFHKISGFIINKHRFLRWGVGHQYGIQTELKVQDI